MCKRSQLLLLAKLLDKLLAADETPELELVVDVGDVDPLTGCPGSVFVIAFIAD